MQIRYHIKSVHIFTKVGTPRKSWWIPWKNHVNRLIYINNNEDANIIRTLIFF